MYVRESSHSRRKEAYACIGVPPQNVRVDGRDGGQEVTSHGVMEEFSL